MADDDQGSTALVWSKGSRILERPNVPDSKSMGSYERLGILAGHSVLANLTLESKLLISLPLGTSRPCLRCRRTGHD